MNDEPIEILSSDATLQSWDDDIQVITKKPEQSYPLVASSPVVALPRHDSGYAEPPPVAGPSTRRAFSPLFLSDDDDLERPSFKIHKADDINPFTGKKRVISRKLSPPLSNWEESRKGKGKGIEIDDLTDDEIDRLRPEGMPIAKERKRTASAEPAIKRPKAKKGKTEEEKAAAAEEKERIKATKRAEKELKKKETEVNKLRTDKTEAFREILIDVSSSSTDPSTSIHHLLPTLEAAIVERRSSLSYFSSSTPNLIRFRRRLKARYDELLKRFIPLEKDEIVKETTAIIYLNTPDLIGYIREGRLLGLPRSVRTELTLSVKAQVMIFVQGFNGWTRAFRKRDQREFAAMIRENVGASNGGGEGAKKKGKGVDKRTNEGDVTPELVEKAMVELQVSESCFVMHAETDIQVLDGIISAAGDIAVRPYKMIEKTHLSFCPDKSLRRGASHGDTYRKMLEQIPKITPSASNAVVSEYPTFRSLMEAWDEAESEGRFDDAEGLISELLIQHNRSGMPSMRKINQAASKRVHLAFRGENDLALIS